MNAPVPRRWQLVIVTEQPARAARFWRHALSYVAQPPPSEHASWDDYAAAHGIELRHGRDIDAAVDPTGSAPRLLFVRDDTTQRGPVSIEILHGNTENPATEATIRRRTRELTQLGATHVTTDAATHPWAQLVDPDDHPFRLI